MSSPPSPTPRACPDALLGGFKRQLQDVSAKGRKGQGWGSHAPPADVSNESNLEVAGKAGVGGTRRGERGWRKAGTPGAPRDNSEVEASAGTLRGHPPLDVAAEAVELPVEAHAAVAEDVEAAARRRGSPGAGHHELVAAQLEGAGLQAQQLRQRQQGQLAVARPQAAQLPRRDGGQARPGGRRARHLRHYPCPRRPRPRSPGSRGRCPPASSAAGPAWKKRVPRRAALLSALGAAARPARASGTTPDAPGPARVGLELGTLRAGRACSPPRVTHPPRVRRSTPGAGPAPAWPTPPGPGWGRSARGRWAWPLGRGEQTPARERPHTSADGWGEARPSPWLSRPGAQGCAGGADFGPPLPGRPRRGVS